MGIGVTSFIRAPNVPPGVAVVVGDGAIYYLGPLRNITEPMMPPGCHVHVHPHDYDAIAAAAQRADPKAPMVG